MGASRTLSSRKPNMDRTTAAAGAISAARLARSRLGVLPPEVRPSDERDAYRVQDSVHRILTESGWGPVVGYKIGCTTPVMQEYLGIANPCAGAIFENGVHASGATLSFDDFLGIGVECEIAVQLCRDVHAFNEPAMAAGVATAVGFYMPAIEIVDNRYQDWGDAPTLIADDFFAAGCVLGEPVERDAVPDLAAVVGKTVINDLEVGRGTGADVMGHPHNALAWLVNSLAARGISLKEGEIVLTGSLVPPVWLKPHDRVLGNISGLGSVTLNLR
jgi:2-keto-4-pentenoate hydratase